MANASRKRFGKAAHGKGDGSGAMTDTPPDTVGENQVLSNHDKAEHNQERGQDSKWIESEQHRPGAKKKPENS